MQLTFVDNNAKLDNATKAVIRRQAARGHNRGRKLNRPSRVKTLEQQKARSQTVFISRSDSPSEDSSSDSSQTRNNTTQDTEDVSFGKLDDGVSWIQPQIGDRVSVLNIPVEVSYEDRPLLYEAFSFMTSARFAPGLARALQNHRGPSFFAYLMFTDQAYYHCALAVAAEASKPMPKSRASAMRHITKSFRLVNERLSTCEPPSSQTMAVVMSLSAYEAMQGRYDNGAVHVAGLLRMVEMGGGLERLGYEEPLLMMKSYRADLDYSLRLGKTPKLDIEIFERVATMKRLDLTSHQPRNVYEPESKESTFRQEMGLDLSELWDASQDLVHLINEASNGDIERLCPAQFMSSHIWLGHRLLHFAPLNESRSLNRVQRIVHLGLLTMVNSFLCGLDRRVVENPLLSSFIREELLFNYNDSHSSTKLLLWLSFIGGVVTLQDPTHDSWLLPKTWALMQTLKLQTWKDIQDMLLEYPWIAMFYQKEAASLFERVSIYGNVLATT